MAEVTINANAREIQSKGYIHGLRDQGKIPAVVYGMGTEAQPVELNVKELESIIRKKGRNTLIDLVVGNKSGQDKFVVMVKELQRDPLKGNIIHADLCKISMKEKINTTTPVALRGEPEGQKDGGILQTGVRELEIECLPANIPDSIQIDISALNIGDRLTVGDIPESPDYKILTDSDTTLVSIVAPRMAEEPRDGEGEAAEGTEAGGAPAGEGTGPETEAGE
ncbi:MAG: 50S ribosomal protein L25 [Firmicutes bacterium HGW-Firmicutes-14]|nr:MAG: 50S ribosomal protein L25 [Firmicutes bacterium HGW-Firmicutes-14]